jgi:hypothetical protein
MRRETRTLGLAFTQSRLKVGAPPLVLSTRQYFVTKAIYFQRLVTIVLL